MDEFSVWRPIFDELVCAMTRAAEAFGKPSLSKTDRKAISEKLLVLANLIEEVADLGELPFDATRAAQIRAKVEEVTALANQLIEKGEALLMLRSAIAKVPDAAVCLIVLFAVGGVAREVDKWFDNSWIRFAMDVFVIGLLLRLARGRILIGQTPP